MHSFRLKPNRHPVDITSTSAVAGYSLVVTFTISSGSSSEFSGFWKYGLEKGVDEATNHWYNYGIRTLMLGIANYLKDYG